jgi:hypothetical protein
MALQEAVVISHHSHTHKDRHLGIDYAFKPNEKVQIPLAAAVHFFGAGLPMDAPAYKAAWKRHGFTDDAKGEAYLKKFEVKIVELVPAGSDVSELKEENAKTLNEVHAAHEELLAEMEEDHREELQRINSAHAIEIAELKTRIASLEQPNSKQGKSQ